MVLKFIIFILFLSVTAKVPYKGTTHYYCYYLANKDAGAWGGEKIYPKLLKDPVRVTHAENRFPMHRLKSLFLSIRCLPFAYGDTKLQDLQSQTLQPWGIYKLFESSSCPGTFTVLKITFIDHFFRPAALLVS